MRNLIYKVFVKRFWIKSSLAFFFIIAFAFWSNYYIVHSTKNQIIKEIQDVPRKKIAIVLGASKLLHNDVRNPYFYNRVIAAADLFNAGKVVHVLVSGDNHSNKYNESEDMKQALMELGVPDSCITMDFAGFRTFDSMIRAKKIFGIDDCIIVTQKFHLERALFIANSMGISAVGYPAKDVVYKGVNLREFGAKFKAVLDCYVLPTQPKFLGKSEPIYY